MTFYVQTLSMVIFYGIIYTTINKGGLYLKKANKEKPIYNVWQNVVYVVGNAWEKERRVILVILAQIFLTVAASVAAMYLPKTVVQQIMLGASINTLVITALAFTVVIALLQATKVYFDSAAQPRRVSLRIENCHDILVKAMTTDYANLETKEFSDAKQKANDVTNNNGAATEAIYTCLSTLGTNILGFIVYIALLISVDPLILLLTAVTTVFGVIVRRWANRWQHDHEEESAAFNKRIWYINDIGSNYKLAKDIRLFSMLGWIQSIHAANMKLHNNFERRVKLRHLVADVVDCAATFAREGVVYGYLIWQVLNAGLAIDSFILLFAAISGFSGWIMGILNDYATLTRQSLDFCLLRRYLEYPDKFRYEDGEEIKQEPNKAYQLELRDVSFRYSGATQDTLTGVNLVIKPGERLAIVGLNGAGKTTLVKLLCGFYDPTKGTVLLNGKDIRIYNRKQYYTLFTAVFQEFNILPITIAENVAQHTLDTMDTQRVMDSLKLADIDKKILSLPDGINSLLLKEVNEEAVELSGGETQKLMLARALYKNSPILLLDEPTAALDPIAESSLYERYNELSAGKTSIYISHRLASTRFCDRILLVSDGAIAECGTHDELIKQGGGYAKLYEIQSRYYSRSA